MAEDVAAESSTRAAEPREPQLPAGSDAPSGASQFEGLAAAFAAAVDGVRQRGEARVDKLSAAIERHEQDLGTAVDGLMVVREAIDRLTQTVASVQETDLRQESVVTGLYKETQELGATIGARIDVFGSQIEDCQKEIGSVKATMGEVCSRLASISERVDRHAEAIRSVCEAETMGEIALDQFVEIWTRLKASVATNAVTRVSTLMESQQKSSAAASAGQP